MKKLICLFIFGIAVSQSFLFAQPQPEQEHRPSKQIKVYFNTNLGRFKDLGGVNVGPGNAVAGYKDAGIYLIRTHDFYGPTDYEGYTKFYNKTSLSFDPNFDPKSPEYYDWTSSDEKMAAIVDNGFTPYFRLGISWPSDRRKTPVTPPFDPDGVNFSKFAELCVRTIMHYNDGWDNGFHYNIKYWEVWNEPDGRFWRGKAEDFHRMYEQIVRAIKAYDPDLKVGGPGVTPGSVTRFEQSAYSSDFLEYCRDRDVPLDFYSWHIYRCFDPSMYKYFADRVRNMLDGYGFTETESHLNETNLTAGYHMIDLNSPTGAAFTTSILMTIQESPVELLMWYRGERHVLGIFNNDNEDGTPNYKWNGYGFKAMNYLVKNTPVRILADASEVDTNPGRLKAAAGKSEDGKEVYVLISNYACVENEISVKVSNLPWDNDGDISYTRYIVKYSQEFTEETKTLEGGKSIEISFRDMLPPTVTLLKFRYIGSM